jgi:hypothetical protein
MNTDISHPPTPRNTRDRFRAWAAQRPIAVIVLTAAVTIIARRRLGRSYRRTLEGSDVSDVSARDQTGATALPSSGIPTVAPSAPSHDHQVASRLTS